MSAMVAFCYAEFGTKVYNVVMTTRLRARFDGKALVPTEPVDLPLGEDLDIEIHNPGTDSRRAAGSPGAVLRALAEPPHLSREDVAELERVIAENQAPPSPVKGRP